MKDLITYQKSLAALITAPQTDTDSQLQKLIQGSDQFSAKQRLQVYREMYRARLTEALYDDFDLTLALLKPYLARELVESFVESTPSRSYTLEDYGRAFPAYLKDQDQVAKPIGEFAKFEQGLNDRRRLQVERCTLSAAVAVALGEDLFERRLFLGTSCLIQSYAAPISEIMAGEPSALDLNPDQQHWSNCFLIYHHKTGVRHQSLSRAQRDFLWQFAEPVSLNQAVEDFLALAHPREAVAAIFNDIYRWLDAGVLQLRK